MASSFISVAASLAVSGATRLGGDPLGRRDEPGDRVAALGRQADQQPPLVDLVLGQLDQAARLQPVDDALDGGGIHGDQLAELVLRGLADIGKLGERGELRRRQVGDVRGEDRDMALVRLAQDEADLVLQPVGLGRIRVDQLEDVVLAAHLWPSQTVMASASSPPMRLCTRPPQAMASTKRISSGRGPSEMPTSMASKWLRT